MIYIRRIIRKTKYILMGFFSRFKAREDKPGFIYEGRDENSGSENR